ncbi:MAG TPA: hypothetical protein VHW24_11795, partial [Bryobacteraceae bacterium]|nr:hypothetical protein [Bryobacteraceae bacterium]
MPRRSSSGTSDFPMAPAAPKIAILRMGYSKGAAADALRLARISHTVSTAARDKAASTSLRLVTVLDVLF